MVIIARSLNIFKRKRRLIAIMKSYVENTIGGSASFCKVKESIAKELPTQNLSAHSFPEFPSIFFLRNIIVPITSC